MTPPQRSNRTVATSATRSHTQHPRRPPANRSVSLLHEPRQQERVSDSSSEHKGKDEASPSSLAPLQGRGSSGESSNAEKWFERSNNDVKDQSTSYADNDPPFFMRNSSSSDEPVDGQRSALRYLTTADTNSLPMRAGLLHLGTDGSSTEDFRSVIDDLTIANKKLKRRLKKYEKLHDSHLKDEKLFEIRIHGLPADKKRELEETLRNFTAGLSNDNINAGFPSNGYEGLRTMLQSHKTASSATSLQQPDSAYASMSASGGQGSSTSDSKAKASAQSARSRHQNIHTYLHHIPEGLLPQQNLAMISEREKKKLVVRRLEQIFAGTGATAGGHQQAEQQQSVSQDAARIDRLDREAQGQRSSRPEGYREAHFMKEGPDDVADTESKQNKTGELASEHATDAKLEQRPTRPLDLDPHRAQIPADNMRYIRRLGFDMPDEEQGSPQDDEGWVYLNVLVNMAQLHTMSVTADFVRKALGEFSKHLELSEDLRKVRWKGERTVTRTSSNGGDSSFSRTTDDNNSSQSPRKRVRLSKDALRKLKASQKPTGSSTSRTQTEPSRFAYTPLFFHRDSAGDEESSSESEVEDDTSSPFPAIIGGNSSGMTSSGIRTTSGTRNHKKHDDGPIIFYNNARFCTDLSGDRKTTGSYGAPAYNAVNTTAIGRPQPSSSSPVFERRGPLNVAASLPEPMDLSDNPIPQSMELNFPAASPPQIVGISETQPINLEVSGIGGVYPADNFCIQVEAHYSTADSGPAHPKKSLPPQMRDILGSNMIKTAKAATHSIQKSKITAKTELVPSALPPALSYMITESDSLSDDGSEAEDVMSISPDSPDAMPREPAPQQLDLPYSQFNDSDAEMDDEGDEDSSEESDAESDGSLDLLAAAREIDPDAVRAREREYDANMAERLAEEIPAGSSAATAGGGSGFASPASGVSRAEWKRAKLEARLSNSQRERERHRQSSAASKKSKVETPVRKRKAEEDEKEDDISSDAGEGGSVSS